MLLELFDVEHGACALITTSNNRRVMIDCGHNSTTGWRPSVALAQRSVSVLDKLVISNYDEDHVSSLEHLLQHVGVKVLVCNPSVSPAQLRYLKSEDGMGRGIDTLAWSREQVFTLAATPDPIGLGDVELRHYWNEYGEPPFGFNDENNLSLVTFVTCCGHKVIFPGDLEKAGWKRLLTNPQFRAELATVTVFVASHHGRENGFCEEVMSLCTNIRTVVISDKKKHHQSQETVEKYRAYAHGFMYYGTERRVLTTRSDGSMRFFFDPLGEGQVWLNQVA